MEPTKEVLVCDVDEFVLIPGLTGLNLNILHGQDKHRIEDTKNDIQDSIKVEHPVVQTVQRNFLALLKTKLPREQHESRRMLEEIVERLPNNLNALADLEKIYEGLYRMADAKKCRNTYETICKGESRDNMLSKATCMLEQGFAIRIERTLVNEYILQAQITDFHQTLNTACENSDGKRKECLEKCLSYNEHTLITLQQANSYTPLDGHCIRMRSSLLKFKRAMKSCSLSDLHPAWRFQYAKTLNQYYESLENLSRTRILDATVKDEMRNVTVEAIEIFWNFTQEVKGTDMERYIAQACAYIGHILSKRKDLVTEAESICHIPMLSNPDFVNYLENPILLLKKSYQLFPKDTTVLNRYGRSFWLKAIQTKDDNEAKRENLENALKMLTESLHINNTGNRFAYSTRMFVRRDLAKISVDMSLKRDYLKKAKKDGHECFMCMPTRRDMTILAEICQTLAKFPDTYAHGPESLTSKKDMFDALDYMHYANNLGEPIDNHSAYRMASCLFDLGEYEKAVEWQQRALFLAGDRSSSSFFMLCIFILALTKEKCIDKNVVTRFVSFLIIGKRKYGEAEMNTHYKRLYNKKKIVLINLLETIIVTDHGAMSIDDKEKEVVSDCLIVLKENAKYGHKTKISELQQALSRITPVPDKEYELTDLFDLPYRSSLPPRLSKAFSNQFEFDYFICYSNRDKNVVHTYLIPQLETKLNEFDNALKGNKSFCRFPF